MEEQKKVYLVTAGEFSSYHIMAAFSSRSLAEKYIDTVLGEEPLKDPEIEEFALDAPRASWTVYTVYMNRKGDVDTIDCSFEQHTDSRSHWTANHTESDFNLVLKVAAEDKEQAVKATNERRAYHLGTNSWGKAPMHFGNIDEAIKYRRWHMPANYPDVLFVETDADLRIWEKAMAQYQERGVPPKVLVKW